MYIIPCERIDEGIKVSVSHSTTVPTLTSSSGQNFGVESGRAYWKAQEEGQLSYSAANKPSKLGGSFDREGLNRVLTIGFMVFFSPTKIIIDTFLYFSKKKKKINKQEYYIVLIHRNM